MAWILLVIYILCVRLVMGSLRTVNAKRNFLFVASFALFLLMSLRGDNYVRVFDVRIYKEYYENMRRISLRNIFTEAPYDFEYGYVLLNKMLSTILPFSQFILFFEAGFCVYSVCRFIYLNSDDVFLSFFFYITLGSMSFMLTGFRQSIAICICLYGVEYVKKEKLFKFIGIIILAILMHRSAIVFAPLYFIVNNKYVKSNRSILGIIVIAMVFIAPVILSFGKFISGGEFKASSEMTLSFNGIVPIIIYCVGLFPQFWLYYRDKGTGNKVVTISIMLALGLGLYLMRYYNVIIERLAWYYTQSSYICLANFCNMFKKNNERKVVKIIAILLASILFVKRLQTAEYANYVFFWN